jgi:hypothetical protein
MTSPRPARPRRDHLDDRPRLASQGASPKAHPPASPHRLQRPLQSGRLDPPRRMQFQRPSQPSVRRSRPRCSPCHCPERHRRRSPRPSPWLAESEADPAALATPLMARAPSHNAGIAAARAAAVSTPYARRRQKYRATYMQPCTVMTRMDTEQYRLCKKFVASTCVLCSNVVLRLAHTSCRDCLLPANVWCPLHHKIYIQEGDACFVGPSLLTSAPKMR